MKAVAAGGGAHSLLLKSDGTLWAAGRDTEGQLGTGDNNDVYSFVKVLTGVSAVSEGSGCSLALKSDGTLWATGRNDYGQLGTGDNDNRDTYTQVYQY